MLKIEGMLKLWVEIIAQCGFTKLILTSLISIIVVYLVVYFKKYSKTSHHKPTENRIKAKRTYFLVVHTKII